MNCEECKKYQKALEKHGNQNDVKLCCHCIERLERQIAALESRIKTLEEK